MFADKINIKHLFIQTLNQIADPNVLFRANSLTTKVIDLYMKIVGMPFLHSTLTDIVMEVYGNKESCEVFSSSSSKGEENENSRLKNKNKDRSIKIGKT